MPKARRGEKLHEFKDFSKGLNTEVETHLLDPEHLADVCNFDVDKPGVLRTRKGYRKLNEAQIAAYPIRGLHEIISNGKRYLVAFCGGHMFRYNDSLATFEEIYAVNERSTASTLGPNLVPDGDFTEHLSPWTPFSTGTNTSISTATGELKILSTAPTELLTNGNFEGGITTGWTNTVESGDYIGDTVGPSPHSGSKCLDMRNIHSTHHTYSTSAYTTALDNAADQVGLSWFSSAEEGTATLLVLLSSCDSSGTVLNQDDVEYEGPDSWTQRTLVPTQSATQNKYKVTLWSSNNYYDYSDGLIQYTSAAFDDISITARPRFSESYTSPLFAVDGSLESTFAIGIKCNSNSNYSGMNCYVDVEWYTSGSALISTSTYFTTPATTTVSKTFTAAIPKGGIPATATQAKVKVRMSGYFDGYDSTAAGHGFVFDNVDFRQVSSTSTTERIERLTLDESVRPSCSSFMGRIYVSGYDKTIRLTDGVGVDYIPDIPVKSKYNCVHINRLWLANCDDGSSRLYYSDLTSGGSADPDSVSPLDCLDLDPDDGDEITGLSPVSNGLAVFKKHSTYHITGSSYESWYVEKKSGIIGCASHRTICNYSGRLVFLDGSLEGVYVFAGTVFDLISADITSRIKRIQHPEKAFAVMHDNKYYLFCDDQDSTKPYNDTVLVYSFVTESWTVYHGIFASAGLVSREDGKFLIGDGRVNTTSMLDGVTTTETTNGGYVYSFLEGYHDDGQKIEAQFTTGDMPIRGMGRETRIRKVLTWARSGSDTQGFTIDYASDRSSTTTEVTGLELAALGNNKWGVGEWQSSTWGPPHLITPGAINQIMCMDGTTAVLDAIHNTAFTKTGSSDFMTILGASAPVIASVMTNRLSSNDASFESTVGSWAYPAGCTAAVSTDYAYLGSKSLKMTCTATDYCLVDALGWVGLGYMVPSTQYTFSGRFKGVVGKGYRLSLYDNVGGRTNSATITADGTWQAVSMTHTTGAGTTNIEARIEAVSASLNNVVYWDDMRLVASGTHGPASCTISMPTATIGLTSGMPLTIMCAVNTSWAGNDGAYHVLASWGAGELGANNSIGVVKHSDNMLRGWVTDATGTHHVSYKTCTAGNWAANTNHLIIATFGANGVNQIYLDGVAGTASSAGARESALAANIHIGTGQDIWEPLNGGILCAIWDGVLA